MLIRPRRSILFLPGSNTRAIEKARGLDCDSIIFDLEDAVAPEKKLLAREQVLAAVGSQDFGRREKIVRINAFNTIWGDHDAAAFSSANIDGVMLPKVESTDAIEQLADVTEHPIWCNIETPLGVLGAANIAAHKKVAALVAGTNDLSAMLRVPYLPDRTGLLASLGLMILAARAHDKLVFDGTFTHITDDKGFLLECRQGWALGFDGKTLIHPDQIAPANQIFSPSAQEIAAAQEIVATYMSTMNGQSGVAIAGGKMIEKLHFDAANRLLQMADAISNKSKHL
jgi:citrate lyase beta subunit